MTTATDSAEAYGGGLLPSTTRALMHRVAVEQARGRTPSLLGGVVRDGALAWCGSRSMIAGHAPDANTQYRIGSLTKSFVAVLVMRLRDEGRLELTDPLATHLSDSPVGHLTIGQLLAHTSGIASETPGPWWERTPGDLRPELADVLGPEPVKHPAGRRHHYSNPGFALLGAVVERLHGQPWGDVLREEVLNPLGMVRTSLVPSPPAADGFAVHPWADVMVPEAVQRTGVMAPAGELWSTIEDLARWAAFLAGGKDGVLAGATVAHMREPAAPADATSPGAGYGLGLQLTRHHGRALFGHTGSMPGFVAALWISAEDELAGIALANSTSGPAVSGLAADLVALTAEAEPAFPEPWRPADSLEPALLELAGAWYWGTTSYALRVTATGDLELRPLAGQGRGTRFHVEHDGTWTGESGYYAGETLRVVRRPDGAVSHLDLGSFVFTREPYDQQAPVPGGFPGWS